MQQHIYYIRYALQFAGMQIPELVTAFNAQVQNRGWSSMRAYHNLALIQSALYHGRSLFILNMFDFQIHLLNF